MNNKLFINIINKKKAGVVIFAHILCVLLCVSCRLDIPVKEMAIARYSITRAVEVKSEKYAPEELKKAKNELYKSHDSMKAGDVKAAKKSAEESKKYSDEAITKSLPPLANDTLSEAEKTYEEAETAFAEKYAAEEYALAGAKIGEAESLLADQGYWESYLKSNEAINNAADARDKALSNISALQESINRISAEAKTLESIGAREFAREEMRDIDANLGDAALLLEDKNVKNASMRVQDADIALKVAYQKTWKGIAAANIKAAEDAMQNFEKSPYKDSFAGDMEKAGTLIKESKDLFDREAYNESSTKSEEALVILNSIAIAQEKKSEEKRITEETEEESKIEASLTGEATEYTVRYNPNNRDCLWKIAMITYKDARLWPLIYIANKNQIKDPDLIFPGQKLKIPAIQTASKIKEIKIETKESPDGKLPDVDEPKENEDNELKEKSLDEPDKSNIEDKEVNIEKEELVEQEKDDSDDLPEEKSDDEEIENESGPDEEIPESDSPMES